jgi:hypothetical protein
MPSRELPVAEWLVATARHMSGYTPCGKPATHVGYDGSKPLCDQHAEEMREALRSESTLGNILAGRPRTEREIAAMVRPIQ